MASLEATKTRFRLSPKSLRDIGEAALFGNAAERPGQHFLDQRIPKLPTCISPDELRLLPRTRNSLRNAGLLNSLKNLEGLTIRELMEVKNFGAGCLTDLMRALGPFVSPGGTTSKPSSTAYKALIKEARKLRDTKHAELVCKDDPRFHSSLQEIDYRARDARHAAERLISRSHRPGDPAALAKLIRNLRIRINSLSKLLVTTRLGFGAWGLLGARASTKELQRVQKESIPRSKISVPSRTTEEKSRLESGLNSTDWFAARCRIILASAGGETPSEIAASIGYSIDRVRRIIHDFKKDGLAFFDRRRRGPTRRAKPRRTAPRKGNRGAARRIFDSATTAELQKLLAQNPGDFGKTQNSWTGPLLAQVCLELGLVPRPVTAAAVYKALRAVGIHLSKEKNEVRFPLIKLSGRVKRRVEIESQSPDRSIRIPALILLARARGESQRDIAWSLACSPGTVRRVVLKFTGWPD